MLYIILQCFCYIYFCTVLLWNKKLFIIEPCPILGLTKLIIVAHISLILKMMLKTIRGQLLREKMRFENFSVIMT
jgi:hypothetical protein